jgi:hypothetical protein
MMITRFEQAILLSVCLSNKGSLSSHVPKPYFMKKLQKTVKMQKHADRALHSLISLGFITVHPTRGEMTYALSQLGLEMCRNLKDKGFSISNLLASGSE